MKNNRREEVESLNVEDLDIEELEHRIELAAAMPTPMAWLCTCDLDAPCDIFVCEEVCTEICTEIMPV